MKIDSEKEPKSHPKIYLWAIRGPTFPENGDRKLENGTWKPENGSWKAQNGHQKAECRVPVASIRWGNPQYPAKRAAFSRIPPATLSSNILIDPHRAFWHTSAC